MQIHIILCETKNLKIVQKMCLFFMRKYALIGVLAVTDVCYGVEGAVRARWKGAERGHKLLSTYYYYCWVNHYVNNYDINN